MRKPFFSKIVKYIYDLPLHHALVGAISVDLVVVVVIRIFPAKKRILHMTGISLYNPLYVGPERPGKNIYYAILYIIMLSYLFSCCDSIATIPVPVP